MTEFTSSESNPLQFNKALTAPVVLDKSIQCMKTAPSEISPSCIVFMSSCFESWGGSEELWSATATYLKQQGHRVYVFKTNVNQAHDRIAKLLQAGIPVMDTVLLASHKRSMTRRILDRVGRTSSMRRILKLSSPGRRLLHPYLPARWHASPKPTPLAEQLEKLQPDLVVISQGDNFDGLAFASLCQELKLPYAILSHKAGDDRWPLDALRLPMRLAFQEARHCFFVSKHNQWVTEKQIGQTLAHAEVVRNPHLAPVNSALPWQPTQDGWFKLACVGRLWLFDKGQDILLQVLAQDKWKSRRLHIDFFGEGVNRDGLIELAHFLGVRNVGFPGFVDNIVEVWQEFHGLLLPSRAEGLPISLVEAMMCGRLGIVTDVGGTSEIVINNVTGFIAEGPYFHAIDEAIERAWQRRHEWEKIGQEAARAIREIMPPDPERIFANRLLQLCVVPTKRIHIARLTE